MFLWINTYVQRSRPYLSPCLDTLVNKVRKGLACDKTPTALSDVWPSILEHDLALADDNQWGTAAFHAFKNVVFCCLWVASIT